MVRRSVLVAAVFVVGTNISIASELMQRISAIKANVSDEVSHHPAINNTAFVLTWRDFPPTLPTCSDTVSTDLIFYPAGTEVPPSRVTLRVDCSGVPRWTRHIRATISYSTQSDVLTEAVSKGSPFSKSFVEGRRSGKPLDLRQFEGRVARRDLPMGRELRLNDWEPLTVIRKGERVSVTLLGTGFQIETEGEALGDAGLNEKVQLKLPNGNRVSGIVVGENRVVVERV